MTKSCSRRGRRLVAELRIAGLAGVMIIGVVYGAAAQPLPDDFVLLRDVGPTIRQDIRYAGVNNFVGRPLAGL